MTKFNKLNSILQGDCIAGMAKLNAGSIDLAFADPPFNIGYEYDEYDDRKERDEYLAWSRKWIAGVYTSLKSDGTFWLAIGDEYAAELKLISQEVGFHCRSWVIWYYTFGVNCKEKFSRSHAHLFHFVKDPQQFTFNVDAIRIPSARQLVYADARANPTGRLPDDTWVLRPQDLADSFSAEEDTWYFPRVAGTFKERAGFHGCQMPEQLLGRIIRACSREGEVVLDPFSGSATTLVVAKKLGRQYLGFELSKEYAKHGTSRLENVCCGDRLDGSPEPLISAPVTPTGKSLRKDRKTAGEQLKKSLGSESGELERSREIGERALIAAFAQTHAGWSVDRVVADPELNASFVQQCQATGIPGDARSWNWSLFALRKAGKLTHVETTNRSDIAFADCEPFLFASEIALRQMLDRGCESVDELLCDPSLAGEFDALAAEFAPGYTPFQYRWAALKLRKEAKQARARAWVLAPLKFSRPVQIEGLDWNQITVSSGVYSVSTRQGKDWLFVGEAMNLRDRLQAQFSPLRRKAWQSFAKDLAIAVFPADLRFADLLGYRSKAVREHKPRLNVLENERA